MDEDLKRVTEALEVLSEHFETTHIFCTRYEDGGTIGIQKGTGNWFARYGQIREFLLKEDEEARANQRDYREDD
jgi:hypothetical protein